MRRAWLIVLIAMATALAGLGRPSSALAGTFTWSLPGDFTTTGSGANPDHDIYGATPWSYSQSGAGGLGGLGHDPRGFTRLPVFSARYLYPLTGLVGWGDDSQSPSALIATNPTGSAISASPFTFPAGELAVRPPQGGLVAIGWTSPLSAAKTVTVTGSVNADAPSGCLLGGYSWSLDQNGTPLESSATSTGSISLTTTVPAAGSIYLTVSPPLVYSVPCATAGVSLTVQAKASAPHLTLSSPGNGAALNTGSPTFSGGASSAFGASQQVTVRVFSGPKARGTPVQILTGTASGDSYSVVASSPLPNGAYTAQAEQRNLASPPDSGLSNPNSFVIHNASPQVRLSSLGSGPLKTATPRLSGVAATASGDAGSVRLIVYRGTDTAARPIRYLAGPVGAQGRFSVRITPELADGQYTARASQQGPGAVVSFSNSVVFRLKLHPPALTLTTPAVGSNTSSPSPVFGGVAGSTIDDNATVAVTLYSGVSARGKPLGAMTARRSGASWKGTWTHRLEPGLYTAVASQRDDVGHTATTRGNPFLVVPTSPVIGAGVSVSANGLVTVPVTCSAPAGQTCTGNVLVTTVRSFRPVVDGPSGHLSVMFTYIAIPGASTTIVEGPMQAVVEDSLRRARLTSVNVTSLLSAAGGSPATTTVTRLISVP